MHRDDERLHETIRTRRSTCAEISGVTNRQRVKPSVTGRRPRRVGRSVINDERRRLAPMSAMICIVLALLGIGGCGAATPSKLLALGGPCSAQPPGCGSAQGTGPNLAGYTWSAAPAPPLSSRSSQTSVWTGTQLLVWGGMLYNQGLTPAADGAAYDPASGSWTPMPTSPLSPRDGAYGFWTGDTALFWGGGNDLGVPLMDGASYDPSDRTWTRVPASPLRVDADARQTVVWTGTQMVVIQPAGGAAFDPATDDWARVPALPSVSGWQPYAISAEWTGSAVVTWVAARPPTVNGITPGGYHFSTYWWAPGGDSWTSIPVVPADNGSFPFGTAASFGGRLLFLGGSDCGPGISCPAGFYGALWYDPSSGKWTGLPNTFSGGAGPAARPRTAARRPRWRARSGARPGRTAGTRTRSGRPAAPPAPGRSSAPRPGR